MRKESDQIVQHSLGADSFLCERCSKIDLNEILSLRTIPPHGHRILDFRSASKIVENPNCSFCQAFDFIEPPLFVKPSHHQSYALVAVHSKVLKVKRKPPSFKTDVLPEDNIFLTTESGRSGHVWRMEHVGNPPYELSGCLALPAEIKEEGDLFMADSIGSTVEFNMLRSWIKTYEKKHGDYCAPSSTQNSTLRLIECNSRRVVATPKPPEVSAYAALSYVWGSQEPDEVCSEELPKQLPKTIEDAITVTKGLGIVYLWIDRYCIDQNNEHEKHNQCSLMHRIYENAHVTIIAAAGSGPDHGLPGIGSSVRSHPSVRIGSHLLVPTLPDPRLSIRAAKWSTRGWTYQESVLSKRRLIFTDRQVLFVCRRAYTDEAEQKLKPDTELPDGDIRPSTSLSPFCMSEESPRNVWDNISQFSKLDLSRQEDFLNAMLGIFQRYQESGWKYGVHLRHLAGLPVVRKELSESHEYLTWTRAICESLGWTTLEPSERRKVPHSDFPSWSWTGWKAASYYVPETRVPCCSGTFRWNESVFVEYPDGYLVKGNELDSLLQAGHDFSRIRFIHLKAPSLICSISQPSIYSRFPGDRRCVIRHRDAELVCPVDFTDLSVRISENSIRCWGIMVCKSLKRGSSEPLFLLVTKVKDWYERIGVTEIPRTGALQKVLRTRSFRLG